MGERDRHKRPSVPLRQNFERLPPVNVGGVEVPVGREDSVSGSDRGYFLREQQPARLFEPRPTLRVQGPSLSKI
jgi:hypothetical protein